MENYRIRIRAPWPGCAFVGSLLALTTLSACFKPITTIGNSQYAALCTPNGVQAVSLSRVQAEQKARAADFARVQKTGLTQPQFEQACGSSTAYVCNRALFSPDVSDGNAVNLECAQVSALDSPCLHVATQSFNTRGAVDADPSKAGVEPGGVYNHSEYSCYNSQVRAGKEYLALGLQRASLTDALKAAYDRCNQLAAAAPAEL